MYIILIISLLKIKDNSIFFINIILTIIMILIYVNKINISLNENWNISFDAKEVT